MPEAETELPVVTEEPVSVSQPKEKKSRKKAVKIAKPQTNLVAPVKSSLKKKMSDTEKKSLSDHMGTREGTPTEIRSHRMKVMSRMRKGMSIEDALKDIS